MKKIIGAIGGCIAAYYVIDVLATLSMATAWNDLVKYGHMQAAHELDDTIHKNIASATERYLIL